MTQRACILLAIENRELYAQINGLLTSQGHRVQITESGEEAISFAQELPLDLILATIRTRDLDGLEVCRRLRVDESTCDIPVVFLETEVDATVRVKARNLGVADFLPASMQAEELAIQVQAILEQAKAQREVKERLRLLEQENRELRERVGTPSREKSTSPGIQDRENFTQNILQASPNLIYIYDLDRQCNVYANQELVNFLGYSAEHVQAMGPALFENILHPDDAATVSQHQAQMREAQDGETLELEYRMKHASGFWRWLRSRDTAFRRSLDGKVDQILGICEDITERKRWEVEVREKDEHIRAIYFSAMLGIIYSTPEGRFLHANPAFQTMLGYSEAELQRLSFRDITHPDNLLSDVANVEACVRGEQDSFVSEKRYLRKDGHAIWGRIFVTLIRDEAKQPKSFIGLIKDTSEENKGKATSLENEARLRQATESSNTGLWDWDLRNNEVHYSPIWKRQIGYEEHEISDRFEEWESRVHPEDIDRAKTKVLAFIENPWPDFENEFRFRHKDGSYRWILAKGSLMTDDAEKPIRMLGSHIDITERKRAEETIRAERENFQRIFAAAPVGLLLLDADTTILDANERIGAMVFKDPAEIIGQRGGGGLGCVHSTEDPRGCGFAIACSNCPLRRSVESVLAAGNRVHGLELEPELMIGGKLLRRWISVNVEPLVFEGRPHVIVSVDDITERKQAEATLRESEAKFSHSFHANPEPASITRIADGYCLEINEAFCKATGWRREEILGRPLRDFWVHPEQRDRLVTRILEQGSVKAEEVHLRARSGKILDFLCSADAITVAGEACLLVTALDITEFKETQTALAAMEATLQQVLETLSLPVFCKDRAGRYTLFNRAFEEFLGRSKDQILGKTAFDIAPPELAETYHKADLDLMERGETQRYEHQVERSNGERRDVMFTKDLLRDPSGGVSGLVGVILDITDRKRAEAALRDSETRYRDLIDTQGEGVGYTDEHENFIFVNPAGEDIFGLHDGQLVGRNLWEFLCRDEFEKLREQTAQRAQGNKSTYELRIKRPDGGMRDILVTAMPHIDDRGQFKGSLGIFRDITERKRVEEALRESNELFALFMRHSPIYAFIKQVTPTESRVVQASSNYEQMIGIRGEDMVGRTMAELFPPEFADKITADDWAVVSKGEVLKLDEELNGRHYTTIKFPITQAGKTLLAGYTIDITDRKVAESALRTSEAKFRSFIENAPDAIFLVDEERRYLMANAAACAMTGYSEEEFQRMRVEDLVPPEARNNAAFRHQRILEEGHATREVQIMRKDGSLVWSSLNAVKIGENLILGFHRDISERVASEAAILDAKLRLELATASARLGVWDWDLLAGTMTWDDRMFELYGTNRAETEGNIQDWKDGLHPDDLKRAVSECEAALKGEAPFDTEFRVEHRDGTILWLKADAIVLRDGNGNPLRMIGLNRDVTERVHFEKALVDSEKRFRELFETSIDGIAIEDTETRFLDCNQAYLGLLGFTSPAELLGRFAYEFTPPEVRAFEQPMEQEALLTGRRLEYEKEYIQRTGKCVPVEIRAWPRYDEQGKPLGFWSIVRDLTAHKEAERVLLESEGHFRDLLDNVQMIAVMLDAQGCVTYCNNFLLKLAGWDPEMVLGEFWFDLCLPEELREEVSRLFFLGLQDGDIPTTHENPILLSNGEIRLIRWSNIILKDLNGYAIGTASLGEDITEQRATSEKILRLNEDLETRVKERTAQLETANKELEAFSYSVSHDLRAPLRSIDGFGHALEQDYMGKLDKDGQHYLQRIRAGSQRMGQLIDDLLSLSRMSRQELRFRHVDLSAMARKILEDHALLEPERKVIWHVEEGLEAHADQHLIQAVLENLIGNAWKFSGKNIEARIEFALKPSPDGRTIFALSDNGAGFDMAYAHKLFGAFQRLHSASEFPGTGIGLATVQRIIHRHGGKVWAESAPGEGATFYFSLS